MSVSITELALRLCRANHTVGFATGNTGPATSPCSAHIMEAQRAWGLIQPQGRKSLTVIVEAAGLVAGPLYRIVESHMEGDVRVIDKAEIAPHD